MEELSFPKIKRSPFEKKWLSMDDYLDFVSFNLMHTVDMDAARKWKQVLMVDESFEIKDNG